MCYSFLTCCIFQTLSTFYGSHLTLSKFSTQLKVMLLDWTQYPEKVWPVWVEWKDYLIITLIIIHNENIRRKKMKQWLIQLSQMTVLVANSLVLMRNWLETPGWSTSWIAAAKMAARISKSVKTACRAKWVHWTPRSICLSCLISFILRYPISFLLGERWFVIYTTSQYTILIKCRFCPSS